MEVLIGIAIGIVYVLILDPLLHNISDLISCLLYWGQVAISRKTASGEAEITAIANSINNQNSGDSTRVIGFSIDPEEEEEEYDDNE